MRYYHIRVTINSNIRPSYFIGSMIRGTLGYALKKVTCINPTYQCDRCFAQTSCLYYNFYERQNSYHNYRIDIELGSGRFDFSIYLFNKACEKLPYILSAIEMMLTKIGLTKNSYKFKDFDILLNSHKVYQNSKFTSIDRSPNIFKLDNYYPDIKIRLLTPIRIKRDNRFLRDDITIEDILRSIYQKEQKLESGEDIYRLDYIPRYKTALKNIYYKPLLRNSNRQKSRMNMDGIMGEIAVIDIDKRSYELLKIGEIIGVGKQTVMGLGRIEIENL